MFFLFYWETEISLLTSNLLYPYFYWEVFFTCDKLDKVQTASIDILESIHISQDFLVQLNALTMMSQWTELLRFLYGVFDAFNEVATPWDTNDQSSGISTHHFYWHHKNLYKNWISNQLKSFELWDKHRWNGDLYSQFCIFGGRFCVPEASCWRFLSFSAVLTRCAGDMYRRVPNAPTPIHTKLYNK